MLLINARYFCVTVLLVSPLLYATERCAQLPNNWPFTTISTPAHFILSLGANTQDLVKANQDAREFAKILQQHLQQKFPANQNIIYSCVLGNVTRQELDESLEKLQQLVKLSDEVYIYFSGHGTQRSNEVTETDCLDEMLVPFYKNSAQDKTPDSELMRDDEFAEEINEIANKVQNKITTILDTCFSSGMLRAPGCNLKAKMIPKQGDEEPVLPAKICAVNRQLQRLKGTLYTASREDQMAFETSSGGLLTQTLLKYWQLDLSQSLDKVFVKAAKELANKELAVKELAGNFSCQQHPEKWENGALIPLQ